MEQNTPFIATESPLVDFDTVCQKLRAAVEPARAHAISLHDATGDVLWLTESSMGPDEHNAVRAALDAFSKIDDPPLFAYDLGDSRSAVVLRAVNTRRIVVGAAMIVMDSRHVNQGGKLKLMTPKLQRALAEFAAMLPDVARTPTLTLAPTPSTAPGTTTALTLATTSNAPLGSTFAVAIGSTAAVALAPTPQSPPAEAQPGQDVAADIDRLQTALRRSPIALYVQRLVPLTKGSQLKRYEVLLRSKGGDARNTAPHEMLRDATDSGLGSMIDRRVLTELIGWLVNHREVWQAHAVMFSVNLTGTALRDEHFIRFVEMCLANSALPKSMIAFEIDVQTAVELGDKIIDIAAALHRLGCPLVLDDFGLRTECFALLRLRAVRYIKLSAEITAKMRSDKVSQAAITAVVQMARVLGMHTVAKRTETAADREWLTALGVDFIQSNAVSPPVAIDSLSKVRAAASPHPAP